VSLKAGTGSLASFGGGGFAGEIPALSVAHGAMFCLMPLDLPWAVDTVLAYGRRELTLAAFAWRVLTGLSSVMRYFVGLPMSEG